MGFKKKAVLLNNFVYSSFNYCPLVWHFCLSKSFYKIEKIQERALRLLHSNLLVNSSKNQVKMEIKRLRRLALEIFKTVNNLTPYYMDEIFPKTTNLTHRPLDVNFNESSTTKCGSNSLPSLGPHIGNSLPSEIKKETEYKKFKNLKCK